MIGSVPGWNHDDTFVSYAQNWEDVVLWRGLRQIENGTYVDVGAADPVDHSVTKALYDRGWSGINVEPVPALHERLVELRPRDTNVKAGAGSIAGQMTLFQVVGTGLSTVVEDVASTLVHTDWTIDELTIEVQTLDEIIRESPYAGSPVHLLKIDVEGFERSVLEGLDLGVTRPWVVVVEATAPSSTVLTHEAWEALLSEADYAFVLFDGLNRFYVAQEHSELREVLSAPVNVFDHPYVSAEHSALGVALAEAQAQLEQVGLSLTEKQHILEGASRELEAKQRVMDSLAQAVSDAQSESAHFQQLARARSDELERLAGSASWRLTGAVRSLAATVRRWWR